MATEWTSRSFDFGRQRAVGCRHMLPCGHEISNALRFDSRGQDLSAECRTKLTAWIKASSLTHNCAVFERKRALSQITARLTQGLAA